MREVSGPIIAIGLTLVAVFVPIAFISGLNGEFYRQFALTIAISTVISAVNSLTLSPAMAAWLLKDHHAPKDRLTRWMDKTFGLFFNGFNHFFKKSADSYHHGVKRILNHKAHSLFVYFILSALTVILFSKVPTGYIPNQDKSYFIGFVQLPDAATLDRTEEVMRKMSDIALKTPGIAHAIAFPGFRSMALPTHPVQGLFLSP